MFVFSSITTEAQPTVSLELANRTLASLSLKLPTLGFLSGKPLYDYVLNNLPARQIEIDFCHYNEAHLEWIKRYLAKHKETIEHFLFTAPIITSEVWSIFQD